eukprot:UN1242
MAQCCFRSMQPTWLAWGIAQLCKALPPLPFSPSSVLTVWRMGALHSCAQLLRLSQPRSSMGRVHRLWNGVALPHECELGPATVV